MHHLGKISLAPAALRRAARERRGEQKAVPVETVDIQRAADQSDPRQIVGKGRPHAGADLDDLGLAERRVQRVGRANSSSIERAVMRVGWSLSIMVAPIM